MFLILILLHVTTPCYHVYFHACPLPCLHQTLDTVSYPLFALTSAYLSTQALLLPEIRALNSSDHYQTSDLGYSAQILNIQHKRLGL